MDRTRTVTVGLSEQQQMRLMPRLAAALSRELALTQEQSGSIVVEVLGRLTPNSALSLWTLNKLLLEEMNTYVANPERYERRAQGTTYAVLAFAAPADSLDPSPDIVSYVNPKKVPATAVPQEAWWSFSQEQDGYEIAQRIGWEAGELANELTNEYFRTGAWKGSMLDHRITLFFRARDLRFQGIGIEDASEGMQQAVQALLDAMRAQAEPGSNRLKIG